MRTQHRSALVAAALLAILVAAPAASASTSFPPRVSGEIHGAPVGEVVQAYRDGELVGEGEVKTYETRNGTKIGYLLYAPGGAGGALTFRLKGWDAWFDTFLYAEYNEMYVLTLDANRLNGTQPHPRATTLVADFTVDGQATPGEVVHAYAGENLIASATAQATPDGRSWVNLTVPRVADNVTVRTSRGVTLAEALPLDREHVTATWHAHTQDGRGFNTTSAAEAEPVGRLEGQPVDRSSTLTAEPPKASIPTPAWVAAAAFALAALRRRWNYGAP